MPAETPVALPLLALMLATDVLLLLHFPPPILLDIVTVDPTQMVAVPEMVATSLTVIVFVELTEPHVFEAV